MKRLQLDAATMRDAKTVGAGAPLRLRHRRRADLPGLASATDRRHHSLMPSPTRLVRCRGLR